jgi:hypothetical protein
MICAGVVVACSDDPAPAHDERNGGTSITGGEPSHDAALHQQAVTLTLGHCWIEPISFDNRRWAALSADQGERQELIEGHESEGTMTLLSPRRARWTSEAWGVIRFRPLWLTSDLAGRGRWLPLIRPLLGITRASECASRAAQSRTSPDLGSQQKREERAVLDTSGRAGCADRL